MITAEDLKSSIDKITENVINLEQANLNLFLENNVISAWILGLMTGGYALIVSRPGDLKQLNLKSYLLVMTILYAIALIASLIQRWNSKSYAVFNQHRIFLYRMTNSELKRDPSAIQKDLEEVGFYYAYSEFQKGKYLYLPVKDKMQEVERMMKFTGKWSSAGFVVLHISFISQFFIFFYVLWRAVGAL